eukprot:1160412-Pelagomonas_calceolata.AAC.10
MERKTEGPGPITGDLQDLTGNKNGTQGSEHGQPACDLNDNLPLTGKQNQGPRGHGKPVTLENLTHKGKED